MLRSLSVFLAGFAIIAPAQAAEPAAEFKAE
jgi:hypothetical protein